MYETLVEATRTNAATNKNVIVLLNSITLDLLQFSFDSSNVQVAKLLASLSDGATIGVNKSTSAVVGDVGEAVSGDGPQPFSLVLSAAHDAPIAYVNSSPQESSQTIEGVTKLMQVNKDNFREGDQVA